MRILSLDLGIKSLGVCVTDPSNTIVIPIENFMFERNDFKTASNHVLELVNKYKVGIVLLGYPLRTDGQKSDATYMSELFFEILQKKLNVTIKLFDESFSTKRGMELLKNKYKDPKKIKENKDMAAAYIMLNDYLTYYKSRKE